MQNTDTHRNQDQFDLVFVLLWGDSQTPLVLSQAFDQAQKQTEVNGNGKPNSVAVWLISSFHILLEKNTYSFLRKTQRRCPNVKIKVIPGQDIPGRIKSGLTMRFFFWLYRKRYPGNVVFHFRTELPLLIFSRYHEKRKHDILILDVRGYWAAELLYTMGIEDVNNIPEQFKEAYLIAKKRLYWGLRLADGVMTVSENLASLLTNLECGLNKIHIVPCCVDKINNSLRISDIRKRLGVRGDEKLLVYSGRYARYQHLEDLNVPFFKLLLSKNPKIKVLILSYNINKIKQIVGSEGSSEKFIFLNVAQHEVADYLSACDLGFLIRKPTLVNTVAQPVKLGEYLAAGVPVCVEGDVGGVTKELLAYDAGVSISISDKPLREWDRDVDMVLEFLNNNENKSRNAKLLAKDYFLWEVHIPRQRAYYLEILKEVQSDGGIEEE